MTQQDYEELFHLAVDGAVAKSSSHADPILARPARLFKELAHALHPCEADKLIDALEAVNERNELARSRRILLDPVEALR
jgi:hypothetical protein